MSPRIVPEHSQKPNKIEQQRDTALDMYELQGKNVDKFRDYYQREQKGNTTPSLNIDRNALEAEMKRRGLT